VAGNPVRIRTARPYDAAARLDLKRQLDSETAFMMYEPNAGQLELILVRSRLATGLGVHRKRTSVTLATPAPDRTAWLPQPCCWSCMIAASMQY